MTIYLVEWNWIEGYSTQAPVGIWTGATDSYFPDPSKTGVRVPQKPQQTPWEHWVERLIDTTSAYHSNFERIDATVPATTVLDHLRSRFLADHSPEHAPTVPTATPASPDEEAEEGDVAEEVQLHTETAERFIAEQSWWIASELARRHPDLIVHEMHPGGGMYDCLALLQLDPAGAQPLLQINRAGSIHIGARGESRLSWSSVFGAESPHEAVKTIEQRLGLKLSSKAPSSTPRTLCYRFISQTLTCALNSRHRWDARNEFIDSSGDDAELHGYTDGYEHLALDLRTAQSLGLYHEPESHVWALLRDEKVAALVTLEGRLYRDGDVVDLMAAYERSGRVSALVESAIGDLI